MNITPMTIMAMFLGGLIGRLLGYNYLVGHLDWPKICGWFSVPIGAALAWILVEVETIAPAFRRSYKESGEIGVFKILGLKRDRLVNYFVSDFREFGKNWRWKTIYAALVGFMWSSWIIGYFFYCTKLVAEKNELVSAAAAFAMFYVMCFLVVGMFFEHKEWDKKTYDITSRVCNDEKINEIRAMGMWYKLLVFNPVSLAILCMLVVIPYCGFVVLSFVVTRTCKTIIKTISILNSSNRMVAMTGAAIGLSISQVVGYNPIICGTLCVVAGLVERRVFLAVSRVFSGRYRST